MKYTITDNIIRLDQRKEINEKILYLIDNRQTDKYGITPQDIYTAYTGDGGLHGLDFSDYSSYTAYSAAKKEIEQGQFFTPHHLCKFLVDCVKPSFHDLAADLTAGMGNFLNWLPNPVNAYGNEIDVKAFKVMRYLYPDANVTADDIRFYNPKVRFDVIFGNPPFHLRWRLNGGQEIQSQLYYCIKAHELLKPGGLLALIVPSSFMADDFQDKSLIKEMDERFHFIYQAELPPNSFRFVGVNFFPTKIMFFQKISEHLPAVAPYRLEHKAIMPSDETAKQIYLRFIRPVLEVREKIKHRLFYENLKENQGTAQFEEKVRKYLFDIKRNPKISRHYAACTAYVHEYATQTKPEGMKWDEWQEVQIKPEQVLFKLKATIRNQHVIEKDVIRLVKSNYGLKLKGYSEASRQFLSRSRVPVSMSFAEMVADDVYPFEDPTYRKLVKRKQRDFMRQSQDFETLSEDVTIDCFLSDLALYDAIEEREIRLKPLQKTDTNKLLQKRYSYLQWDTGAGKSVSAMYQILYRLSHSSVRNVFIIAPAIAIQNNWELLLSGYGYPFRRIQQLSDVDAIQPGEIVLVSLNLLVKYQRFIKRFVKRQSRKAMLVLDEADAIANPQSLRTKAVLNCFRKLPYKLLLSGTMTRNTIAEAAPQLELMYNNSVNMLSECEWLYKRSKDDPEVLEDSPNPYYKKPIPAYNEGYKLFSESHIPVKMTVFGVGQFTQDIFNAPELKTLIKKSIITRSFEEVTGRKPFTPYQHLISFNQAERVLYRQIVEEFYKMDHLFNSTGNPRKDRMLEILQQLLLMLRACTVPHRFKEFNGGNVTKIGKMLSLLEQWKEDRVAIGVRHIEVVNAYAEAIRKAFPGRPLYVITGDRVSLKKRLEVVERLKSSPNAILLCTQQSLSCSMNIGFVDKILIPELYWNDPAMSQFWARFIRFTSESPNKQVHFIVYEESIECNLMGLIMAKQRLNLFMKNQELEDEQIYEKYGVDYNLLDMLMSREIDEDGRTHLRWGRQEIR